MHKSTVTLHETKVWEALMVNPIPRHAALINTNVNPTMGAIFTVAIRQSFGLSRPQSSTPQIHPDSIIPLPMSVAIWAFGAHGQ